MEFRETLLAAQRNQQQKSSDSVYYKARFDPPKKEQKQKDKLSANIQKFLAKKEEEERQKKLEAQRKRDELHAMRDPKALRKIQKTLKVIKSANKSVLQDAIDHEHTAVTREGPMQPDQDDYGYESQEAAAIYQKMMEKYSKIPDEPKFPTNNSKSKKDLKGTIDRVKQALLHEDEPVPHKRRRRTDQDGNVKEPSPPPKTESEKKKEEKPKIRKPMPPPMDFNQLLKLAEQKKSEPLEIVKKVEKSDSELERPMTKKQRKEYEEEMARKARRQERLEAERSGKKVSRDDRPERSDRPTEKKPEPGGIPRIPKLSDNNRIPKLGDNNRIPKLGDNNRIPKLGDNSRIPKLGDNGRVPKLDSARIPKLGDKSSSSHKSEGSLSSNKDKIQIEMEKIERLQREKAKLDKEKAERNKEKLDMERLQKLKAERERIERDIERLNKERDSLEKSKIKPESNGRPADKLVDRSKSINKQQDHKKSIDLKSQNTYRIDKNVNDKKIASTNRSSDSKVGSIPLTKEKMLQMKQKSSESPRTNGLKSDKDRAMQERSKDVRPLASGGKVAAKAPVSNAFDFDKHVNSLKNGPKPNGSRQFPPGDVKRKMNPEDRKKMMQQKRRVVNSDSEYDSEMDDFIDDGEEDLDYSKHIKEIFGYDKSKYRDMDDDDDPTMESSFSRQMHEEYVSKKIGIMEDLEDIRLEKQMNKKKKRRISDD